MLAEDWETAQFAATRVRVEYDEEAHVTDLQRELDEASRSTSPPKPRGNAEKAFAAAAVRHQGEYIVPIEHHNPMELFASTVIWDGDGKLTVYDKTQGVQNVHRYLCGVFGMKPDEVRVMSPFVGGAFGSGLASAASGRARRDGRARAAAFGASRADAAADVHARLPP